MFSLKEFLVILMNTSFANEWEGLENEAAALHQCVKLICRDTRRGPELSVLFCCRAEKLQLYSCLILNESRNSFKERSQGLILNSLFKED